MICGHTLLFCKRKVFNLKSCIRKIVSDLDVMPSVVQCLISVVPLQLLLNCCQLELLMQAHCLQFRRLVGKIELAVI